MPAIVFLLIALLANSSVYADGVQEIFQPKTLRYWAGSAAQHGLNPALARASDFPPFTWDSHEFESGEAWYEFDVPDNAVPPVLAGVLITRIYLTADVYLNHQKIGTGGSMVPPLAKNAHRPLYFTVPASAWKRHGNRIQIHHKSYANMGYLVDILIGPDTVVRPFYSKREFQQQTIPKILFVVEILAGMLVFYIWLARRGETAYLWFSLSILMLSIFTLNQFLIDTYISHKLWQVLNNASIDWWLICLNFFVYRKLGISNRRIEAALWAYGLLALFYYSALPLNKLPGTVLFHGIGFTLILANIVYLARLRFSEKLPCTSYLLFYVSLAAIATHDLLMQTGILRSRWENGHFILYYAAPLSCLLIAGQIVREFVGAMRQVEHHAENLQNHIDRTRSELQKQYQLLQEADKRQAIMDERERIYRDLHDDVGAKLLSLYYRAEESHMGLLAKTALEDLRDIVSRKSMDGEQLRDAIDIWREECEERILDHSVDFVWRCSVDEDIRLSEIQYTHLTRMLREAISNALRHAHDITRIRIEIKLQKLCLHFATENDGLLSVVKEWRHGRGLNNIYIRARELGGSASLFDSSPGHACVSWEIPLDRT